MAMATWATEDEETITGELVKEMDAVLENPASPDWTRYYSVHEEARINTGTRRGKRRQRLDIRIDCLNACPRRRFPFEAKRLGPKHDVKVYLGPEGLGAFVSGEYGCDQKDGGMLGYVQSETPNVWSEKIRKALAVQTTANMVRLAGPWRRHNDESGLQHLYRTSHSRPASVGSPIRLFHTLLQFN
ncbi:MAG: hypothetical protein NTV86_04350 [Planctomycetota bacterium]|nr:hypothetical protein [Planctomycetota bacterium]